MKTNIPSAVSRALWMVHFALAIACALGICYQISLDFIVASDVGTLPHIVDLGSIALVCLIAVIGPLVAEAGYLAQQGMGRPQLWRALFWVLTTFYGVAAAMAIGVTIDRAPMSSALSAF